MTTHTHKGTCQSCGNIQAVKNGAGTLAAHGYTVEYGYFEGECWGSAELPLQINREIADNTIAFFNSKAADLNKIVADHRDGTRKLTHAEFKRTEQSGGWSTREKFVESLSLDEYLGDKEGFNKWNQSRNSEIDNEQRVRWSTSDFEKAIERKVFMILREAAHCTGAATDLLNLADATHGTDLLDANPEKVVIDHAAGDTFEYKNRVYTLREARTITYRNPQTKPAIGWDCDYTAPRSTGEEFLTLKQLMIRMGD